jgi:uncharacterized protein (DUF983 family)
MAIELQGQAPETARRTVWPAIARGFRQTCPACGTGRLYDRYLKVVPNCGSCGEALHHQRADDAPPYFTMLIVGHVAIGGVLSTEQTWAPEPWVQMVVWGSFIVLSSLWLLPRIKGALIGYQWALGMHGFDGRPPDDDPAFAALGPHGASRREAP